MLRRRLGSLLAIGAVFALAVLTFSAARPPAPDRQADSALVHVQQLAPAAAVDSLPATSVSFQVSAIDSVSIPSPSLAQSAPVHDAALDSMAVHSFMPVTFTARPRRVRTLIRDSLIDRRLNDSLRSFDAG